MSRSLFNPQTINSKKRYTTGVYAFKGVDFASQRFSVAQGRAIDLMNFIYKDGVAQVRKGYDTVFQFKAENYTNAIDGSEHTNADLAIYGLWQFTDAYSNSHIIAHVGNLLYEIKGVGTENPKASQIKCSDGCFPLVNRKVDAFVGNYSLYILGGVKLLKLTYTSTGDYSIEAVDSSNDTFIPTTTISITEDNAQVGARQSYDGVNLMTQWRYNKCHTGLDTTSDKEFSYTLDSPIVCEHDDEREMADFMITVTKRGTKSL